jgi:dipeptidyl aminopeptidase/acylaminoacyl peptidase
MRFTSLSRTFALLLLLAPAASRAVESHPFSVHDLLAMSRIADPQVSPDGRSVAFTVRVTDMEANKGRTSVWTADLASKTSRRLTSGEASDSSPRWAPDGKSLYFLSGRGGSSQVWLLPLAGGEPVRVTNEPLDVDAFELFPDGRSLLAAIAVLPGRTPAETKKALDEKAKAKSSGMLFDRLFARHWDAWTDGTRNHLFVVSLPGGAARDLMPAMDADAPSRPFGGLEEAALSPDGKTLVFSSRDAGRQEAWSTNFDLYSVPTDGSAPPARMTTNPAWDTQPRFSPDGKSLAYLAMSRPGYEADRFDIVVREGLAGAERKITLRVDDSRTGDRSPSDLLWSADGKTLYVTAEHLGQKALFAVDAATGKARFVVDEGTVVSPQLLPGGRLLFGRHTLTSPVELFTVAATGGPVEKLTNLNDGHLAAIRFGQPERFSFKGAKGDTVQGYLVKPVDFDPARKYPVAFLIHGGPQGSFGNDFHYRWNPQFYAGAGYATVMIDFHGSTGYGQAFTDAINGDWGGAPYEDLMKGLDHALFTWPFLDGTRVGALGASYGGYMINWIAGKTDRFRCLVSHDGNLDERMAYFDTEELWFPEWEHGGTPWEKPAGYAKHNPVDLVKNWKTPTLVVHGMKDFRVVYTQGLSTFTALQRKGIPSKLLIFPDENHWVLKPQNSMLWHDTVRAWLDQWLK